MYKSRKKTRSLRKNQHFFRQINGFAKEITKELISRKFLSVIAFSQVQVWKSRNFILTYFYKKNRESNVFSKEVTKEMISRNIF